MTGLTSKLRHNGVDYDAQISRVESTHLGEEDHGIWTAQLMFAALDGGWHQGNEARGLDSYDEERDERIGTAFGMDHVMAITRALGCRSWEAIKDTRCLVLREQAYGSIKGIADLSGVHVLIFADHADRWYPAVSS
jgi:hypothetical protein